MSKDWSQLSYDSIIDRRNGGSIKWAFSERFLTPEQQDANPLPMWIADMDFPSPPAVIEALVAASKEGMFGYSSFTKSYVEAVCEWQKKRFDWQVETQWLVHAPSVSAALSAAIQVFSEPGQSVLVQPPVYGQFFQLALSNDREVVRAPLPLCDGRYRFDAEAFEASIRSDTKLFLLCNPHNPTGNVWSEVELRQMGEICERHGVLVVSDEAHEDLIITPHLRHTTFASLGQGFANNCVVCTAPSKTFNTSGLFCANIFIPDERRRARFSKHLLRNGLLKASSLGMIACEAAYRGGEVWLEETLSYVRSNRDHFIKELESDLPMLKAVAGDALYLAWVDCRELGLSAAELENFMLTKARVWFDAGSKFGTEGSGFLRVNLACPRSIVDEALSRMKSAIKA